jgi:hypothetical protein
MIKHHLNTRFVSGGLCCPETLSLELALIIVLVLGLLVPPGTAGTTGTTGSTGTVGTSGATGTAATTSTSTTGTTGTTGTANVEWLATKIIGYAQKN